MSDAGSAGLVPDRDSPTLDRGLVLIMSVATGLAVANQYYNQPVLGLIGRGFAAGSAISLVATASQLGYALGIILLVPLGNQIDRRRLILWQCAGLVLALAAAAAAPGLGSLVAASALVGVFATIAQQIVSFAAELAPPASRGRIVGTMMSGLLVGVLLARTVSGYVGEYLGWRTMFVLGAAAAAAMTVGLAARLPHSRPEQRQPYGRLLLSLLHLARGQPALRRAALTQGLLFASFSAFWSILALLLEGPRFRLGSDVAGLFGILALGGVFIAPYAGRFADRRGPGGVVLLGAALVLLAFVTMTVFVSLAGLAGGVVLMDAGLQLAMVSNQTVIFAIAGPARGRFNTVFMTGLFAFGALGSAAASAAWGAGGWRAVTVLGATLAGTALLVQRPGRNAASGTATPPPRHAVRVP